MGAIYCTKCGATVTQEDKSYSNCGQPVYAPPAVTQQRAEPGRRVIEAVEAEAKQTVTATPLPSDITATPPVKDAA